MLVGGVADVDHPARQRGQGGVLGVEISVEASAGDAGLGRDAFYVKLGQRPGG